MESGAVLIVDFDYESTTFLAGLLKEADYRVFTARNGESGLEIFKKENPDLVVIEPMLPKLHGFELCRMITQDAGREIPVILLSGFYQKEQFRTEELDSFGAAAFLKKPVDGKEILRLVQTLVESPAEAPSPAESAPPPILDDTPAPPIENPESVDPPSETDAKPDNPLDNWEGTPLPTLAELTVEEPEAPERDLRAEDLIPDLKPETSIDPQLSEDGERLDALEAALRQPIRPKTASAPIQSKQNDSKDTTEVDALLESALSDLELGNSIARARTVETAPEPEPVPQEDTSPKDVPAPPPAAVKSKSTAAVAKGADTPKPTPPSPAAGKIPTAAVKNTSAPSKKIQTSSKTETEPEPSIGSRGGPSASPAPEPPVPSSTTFQSFTPPRKWKISPRILIPAAALLVSLFPAYYFLKANRPEPTDPTPSGTTAAIVDSLENSPGETQSAGLEKSPTPVESQDSGLPDGGSPGTEESADGSQADPEATGLDSATSPDESVVQEELAPILPEAKPEPAITQAATRPPDPSPPPVIPETATGSNGDSETEKPPADPAPETPTVQRGEIVPLSAVDDPPVLIRRENPRYPASALGSRVEGTILINALISEKGDVIQTAVLRGIKSPHKFNEAAEAAVRKWKFTPPKKDGERVKVWKVIRIAFKDRGSG